MPVVDEYLPEQLAPESLGDAPVLTPKEASVVEAYESSRCFEALRRLDELGSDGAVQHAARIREVSSKASEVLSSVADAQAAALIPGSGWQELSSHGAHVLYTYDKSTGEIEVIGNLTRDWIPLRLYVFFREFDLGKTWLPNCLECTLVRKFSTHSDLFRLVTAPAVPILSPTESYQDRNYIDALDEHGVVIIMGDAPPLEATEYNGASIKPTPKGQKRIATTVRNIITPLSETQVKLTLAIKMLTPFRWMPLWIVGKVVSIFMRMSMTAMARLYDTWEGSEYKRRAELGSLRAPYYEMLHARMRVAIARAQAQEIRNNQAHGTHADRLHHA